MDWKDAIRNGKHDFSVMVYSLEYEINRLRKENEQLRKELEKATKEEK